MFHQLRLRRQLDAQIAATHFPLYTATPDGFVAFTCLECAGGIGGCIDLRHAQEQHLVYARHVEAGHIPIPVIWTGEPWSDPHWLLS